MSTSIVQINNLYKTYGTGETAIRALENINLVIEKHENIAIVGTSGSGKSTLLNMIGGLDTPDSGSIKIYGQNIETLKPDNLTVFRRRNIGFIFQNFNLISTLNVKDNILLSLKLDGKNPDQDLLTEICNTLGLTDKMNRLPNTLSGGQQQRVAIARALVTKPAIILADEPTGNLDSTNSMEVMGLINMLARKFQQTIVTVTHDEEVSLLSERLIRLEDGKIVSDSGCEL